MDAEVFTASGWDVQTVSAGGISLPTTFMFTTIYKRPLFQALDQEIFDRNLC